MYSLSRRFDIYLILIRNCYLWCLGAIANPYGMLLSRNCPASLRFNSNADRCDYPQNVKCLHH